MMPEVKVINLFEGCTMTSGATVFDAVDTKGFDACVIALVAGTGDAASTAVTTLQLCESDTDPTDYTDGTAVTSFVGAAATSTSAGFVLPALSSSVQNIFQMNVDLRGRKRYLGINFAPEKQTVGVGCVAVLMRPENTEEIATIGTATAGLRLLQRG